MSGRQAVLICSDLIARWSIACALEFVVLASLLVEPKRFDLVRDERITRELIKAKAFGEIEHMAKLVGGDKCRERTIAHALARALIALAPWLVRRVGKGKCSEQAGIRDGERLIDGVCLGRQHEICKLGPSAGLRERDAVALAQHIARAGVQIGCRLEHFKPSVGC